MSYDPQALAPLRWPLSWTDAGMLDLISGCRINCLLFERADEAPQIRAAAERAGIHVALMSEVAAAALSDLRWNSEASIVAVTDARWPGVRLRKGERAANAGPTGAAWIDANGWLARLVRAKAPSKALWLAFKPGDNEYALRPNAYLLAIAEAGVYGARWPITLDPGFAKALSLRDAAAAAHWRRMMQTLDFFEQRRAVRDLPPAAGLGAISDFAGPNQFTAAEFLNLAARRNLLYRVLDKAGEPNLAGLHAAIYLDQEPAPERWRAALQKFAEDGGLVIAQAVSGLQGAKPAPCDLPGYQMWSAGAGRIAIPVKDWQDPWVTAAETQALVGRRRDPVRLFNPGGLNLYVQADHRRMIVHLINYALSRPGDEKTIAPSGRYSSARFVTIGAEPRPVAITRREKVNDELALPPFEVYAAVELQK
ncbi:MAG TPA: hypothetical protein VFA28_14930 [Bryobacteraceae bacterium]|jgi:hypothetical protein|nr:hypothetical protein [Bryobacteraceae bacterium]